VARTDRPRGRDVDVMGVSGAGCSGLGLIGAARIRSGPAGPGCAVFNLAGTKRPVGICIRVFRYLVQDHAENLPVRVFHTVSLSL
jgi:hypothetical protein